MLLHLDLDSLQASAVPIWVLLLQALSCCLALSAELDVQLLLNSGSFKCFDCYPSTLQDPALLPRSAEARPPRKRKVGPGSACLGGCACSGSGRASN